MADPLVLPPQAPGRNALSEIGEYLRRSGRNLADLPGGVAGWLAGGAHAGAEPTLALMRGDALDQPFWPTAESGGRVGAIAAALGATVMPVGAPAGALGAGPVLRARNFVEAADPALPLAGRGNLPGSGLSMLRELGDPRLFDYLIEASGRLGKNRLRDYLAPGAEAEYARILDDPRFVLEHPAEYHFGVDAGGMGAYADQLASREITFPGSRALATDPERAARYAGEGGRTFRVRLPAGARATSAEVAGFPEASLLPGSRFRVAGEGVGPGGRPVTDLELVDDGSTFTRRLLDTVTGIDRRLGAAPPPPAALDMAPEARAARAAEQGYTTDVYHGTQGDITAFDPGMVGSNTGSHTRGFYFTDNPDLANSYAKRGVGDAGYEGGSVIPSKLRMERPFEVDFREEARTGQHGFMDMEDAVAHAKANGHDGAIIRNWNDGRGTGTQYVVFDPSQARSRFAAFDPARKGDPDLLASRAGVPATPPSDDREAAAARAAWIQMLLRNGGA